MSQTETKHRSPFDDFEISHEHARNGIKLDFGDYYFKVAYSGAENPEFGKSLDVALIPVREAIPDLKTTDKAYLDTVKSCFCKFLVTDWGSRKHGAGFMIDEKGGKIDFTPENVEKFLSDSRLEKLLQRLMNVSTNYQQFLKSANESDAKN